jgi:hypothetical protein
VGGGPWWAGPLVGGDWSWTPDGRWPMAGDEGLVSVGGGGAEAAPEPAGGSGGGGTRLAHPQPTTMEVGEPSTTLPLTVIHVTVDNR